MTITRQDVEHVAALARLEFDDAALAQLEQELSRILEYVDMLQQLDTTDIAPLAHPFAAKAPMREDTARPSELSDALLDIAPERQDRFITVPRVIE